MLSGGAASSGSEQLAALTRLARAIESVVPGLSVTPSVGDLWWIEDEPSDTSHEAGEWVASFGFAVRYRHTEQGQGYGHSGWGGFQTASSGSLREHLASVATQLMTEIEDVIVEATTEPWPLLIKNGHRHAASGHLVIDRNVLHMWYADGDRVVLDIPPVEIA